jgi:dimethylhistidine N-methyltransferase
VTSIKEQFLADVKKGLSSDPKFLSSKYFYDERGDDLFVKIMSMPEYYLTRSELEIFTGQTAEICEHMIAEELSVIELGAGDGTKTYHLLKYLKERCRLKYHPVDISQHALEGLRQKFEVELPGVMVEPIHAEYFTALKRMKHVNGKKVVLFLGSNLGNLHDKLAREFIVQISDNLNVNDQFLLGVDLRKSEDIVLPAYDDAQGYTREFNMNILRRINRELGGDFDPENFRHKPGYTEEEGIARSYLVSTVEQDVEIKDLDQSFHFNKGEMIQTEISRKYDLELINDLINGTGLSIRKVFYDNRRYFADVLMKKVS